MVGIVIGDGNAHILAVDLKAALGSVEALQLPGKTASGVTPCSKQAAAAASELETL